MIPGFEKNILGMKVGDKKSFTVLPADGYGESIITQTISYAEIAPKTTQTVDKNVLAGVIIETEEKTKINPEVLARFDGKKTGDMIEENEFVSIKIVEITDTTVTLEFVNKTSPFLGKELTVGLEVSDAQGDYKITAIEDNQVTIEINNKTSPFYGKDFVVGATAEFNGGIIKVLEISADQTTVTLELPNPHQLAGKTLYFEVEVVEAPTPSETTVPLSESRVDTTEEFTTSEETMQ